MFPQAQSVIVRLREEHAGAEGGLATLFLLQFLGAMPRARRHLDSVPILLQSGVTEGVAAHLNLRLLASGPAGLYPDPALMAFATGDGAFEESLTNSLETSPFAGTGHCVLWSVTHGGAPQLDLAGGSLGGALAVSLHELRRLNKNFGRLHLKRLDPKCAVTAALSPTGHLLPVIGYTAKLAAASKENWRVVTAPEQTAVAPSAGLAHHRTATTVPDAVRATRTRLNRTVMLLAGSLILTSTAAIAVEQHLSAQQNNRALALQLVQTANTLRDSDPGTSLLLDVKATQIDTSGLARESLVTTLANTHFAGQLEGNPKGVEAVAFSPVRPVLATVSTDGLALWDTSTSRPRRLTPQPLGVSADSTVAFSPDGHFLVTGGQEVIFWDTTDPSHPVRSAVLPGTANGRVAVSPDWRVLASASGQRVTLWNVANLGAPVEVGSYGLS